MPQTPWEDLKAAFQLEFDTALQSVMQSVNDAPAGELIAGSAEAVRDAVAQFRASMFEQALQLRVDAIEQQLPAPVDPLTSKNRNNGWQETSVLTINGRVALKRRWWHSDSTGCEAPLDAILRADGSKLTPSVAEMCCRLNIGSTSFDRTAADLLRAAQIELSGETVRTIVMEYGQRVLVAQGDGLLATSFTAADCKVRKSRPARKQEHTVVVIDRTTPAANGSADSSVSSSVDNLADEASQPKTGPQCTGYRTLPTHSAPDATVEDAITAPPSRAETKADAEALTCSWSKKKSPACTEASTA